MKSIADGVTVGYRKWIDNINKLKKHGPKKGFLQHFKGSLDTFLEHFIFKNSSKKNNAKKSKCWEGDFGILRRNNAIYNFLKKPNKHII